METTIDSCYSKMSLGDGLNFLSKNWGRLEGGGTNVYKGDSLFFFFKHDKFTERSEFLCWLQMFKLEVETDLPGNPFIPKFQIELQFTDKITYENIRKDILANNYKIVKEVNEQNFRQDSFRKYKHVIDLYKVSSDGETIYLFTISNLIE